jgi:hypothetical protein
MMQSGQNWRGDDGPGSLNSASERCVLGQSQVRAGFVVVKRKSECEDRHTNAGKLMLRTLRVVH